VDYVSPSEWEGGVGGGKKKPAGGSSGGKNWAEKVEKIGRGLRMQAINGGEGGAKQERK